VVVAALKANSQHLVPAAELISLHVADIDISLKVHLFRILSSPTSMLNTETHAYFFIHSQRSVVSSLKWIS
jgi:hypothetical protein